MELNKDGYGILMTDLTDQEKYYQNRGWIKIGDGTRSPTYDTTTHATNIIEYEHHEVHSGSFFRIHINKDVANGGTFNVCFTTPNTTKWLHLTFGIESELECQTEVYEDITSFTGGTGITPLNANRNSLTASGVTDMAYDATPTAGSPVLLDMRVIGSGKNQGGGTRSSNEWILKQGKIYYVNITNQATGATNEVNIDLEWYEHTNKVA